jgi:hypothetical protein
MPINTSVYMKTFNDQFFQFCDDIYTVFPDEITIPQAKNLAMMVRKTNPKLLISIWHRYISLPYEEIMLQDSMDACEAFLMSKDYSHDVRNLGKNADLTLNTIEMMRDRIKNMNKEDKALSMKYVTNLIKLSKLYWNSGSGENHVYYG